MVHRAPDSRLLTNLINHEKEYAKHLAALFPLSHAALASLSAYAAASPSSHPASPAHSIAAVVDVLASADNAFQRYTHALDTWREQLVALKDLEDDLSGILRDRDILVTRLIKASKSTRDHRSSRLVAPLTNISSASLPSTNSTAFSSSSSPASTNAKLAQAQAELQACEAHLVSKEHELDARRITLARDGLGARCRALIDCGWVWSEMGKQGLRALQALSADGGTPKPSLTVPSRLNTNLITYASDHSSLTPSQSASQTAARSVETSNEAERVQPETGLQSSSKPRARINDDADLTLALPPAHAISEVALPTSVRSSLETGDSTTTATNTQSVPRRKRTKRAPRPPSQHITEASDEGSDAPLSASRTTNTNSGVSPRIPHTPYPTARATETYDMSSDDEPTGPLQVVENDPFEMIRRSMLGPPETAPTARASAPDVRMSAVIDASPSKIAFPGSSSAHGHGPKHPTGIGMGSPPGSSPTKRQRRTSMAFFGSLRGLFRRPKERAGRVAWEESPSPSPSPSPALPSRRSKTSGWVTRTDARIKARGGEDSDVDAMTTTRGNGTTMNVVRASSGARLRKGRPSASTRDNGPSRTPSHRTTIDGWITDAPDRTGPGARTMDTGAGTGIGRSRTRRGTAKRKKTSVADLRGNDQGHTDGEVDGSPERVSNKERGKAPEVSGPKLLAEEERQSPLSIAANPIVVSIANTATDPNVDAGLVNQPKRATTTTATTSHKVSPDAGPARRRSASLSLMDAHAMVVSASSSTSTSSQATSQGMSWRKPPPPLETLAQPASLPPAASASSLSSPSQVHTQTQTQAQPLPSSRTHESQPKPSARRHVSDGHAKHAQSQSLMSIVADVTRQSLEWERDKQRVMDKARSLDIPRAPGSVLRERESGEVSKERSEVVNGRGHVRAVSEDQRQGQRVVKMPLRSALRNASRTPSPSPANAKAILPAREVEVNKARMDEDRGRGALPTVRDSASISSYETGRESLYVEEEGEGAFHLSPSPSPAPSPARSPPLCASSPSPTRSVVLSQSQPPTTRSASPALIQSVRGGTLSPPPATLTFTFPPPPVDPPPVQRHGTTGSGPINVNVNPSSNSNGNEPCSSSVSTATATSTETPPAQRRKSVRVSLQPTFSPTPPALGDDDGEYAPWNGSRDEERRVVEDKGKDKVNKAGKIREDVWADSSEEDEAYQRARRLLSLVGRGGNLS